VILAIASTVIAWVRPHRSPAPTWPAAATWATRRKADSSLRWEWQF